MSSRWLRRWFYGDYVGDDTAGQVIDRINELEETLMASHDALQAALNTIRTDVATLGSNLVRVSVRLGDALDELNDKLEAGGITADDLVALDEIHTQLTDHIATLNDPSFGADPDGPTPQPTPEPVPEPEPTPEPTPEPEPEG